MSSLNLKRAPTTPCSFSPENNLDFICSVFIGLVSSVRFWTSCYFCQFCERSNTEAREAELERNRAALLEGEWVQELEEEHDEARALLKVRGDLASSRSFHL